MPVAYCNVCLLLDWNKPELFSAKISLKLQNHTQTESQMWLFCQHVILLSTAVVHGQFRVIWKKALLCVNIDNMHYIHKTRKTPESPSVLPDLMFLYQLISNKLTTIVKYKNKQCKTLCTVFLKDDVIFCVTCFYWINRVALYKRCDPLLW